MTVYFGEIRGGTTPPAHLRIEAGDIKQIDSEEARVET
jgi:hypothetical protein